MTAFEGYRQPGAPPEPDRPEARPPGEVASSAPAPDDLDDDELEAGPAPPPSHSPSTNRVMIVMMTSRTLWNQVMLSITWVADPWSFHSHSAGWPSSANAAVLVISATPAAATPSNRRPVRPIDIFMPFALP